MGRDAGGLGNIRYLTRTLKDMRESGELMQVEESLLERRARREAERLGDQTNKQYVPRETEGSYTSGMGVGPIYFVR